jgi:proline-specific peptidase
VRLESIEKPLRNKNGGNRKGTMTKEYIKVNGARQGLIIESTNQENPLLLFLHGGPGFPIYPTIQAHDVRLEPFFNVCYWDQRGAGMSYQKKETQPLTLEQLIDDTIQVVDYVREKYEQEKVFLLGHSWGTILGSLVASQYPERFHAYIGVGQMGSAKESEKEAYDFILKTAIKNRDTRAQKQIEKVTFDKETYYRNRAYGEIKSTFINKYGVGFKRTGYSNLETLKDIMSCSNYTFKERLNILRGSFSSYQSLGHTMAKTDLVKRVPKLDLPFFILHGLHDYQTTYTQAKRFYESVEAPAKKMYTFEHSAHAPFLEEKDRFYRILREGVLEVVTSKVE